MASEFTAHCQVLHGPLQGVSFSENQMLLPACAPPAQVQEVTKPGGGVCQPNGQNLDAQLGDAHGACEVEPGIEGKEKGDTLARQPALCAPPHSGTELQATPCSPCHFEGMFVKLEDKLYLIHQFVSLTYKYLNI